MVIKSSGLFVQCKLPRSLATLSCDHLLLYTVQGLLYSIWGLVCQGDNVYSNKRNNTALICCLANRLAMGEFAQVHVFTTLKDLASLCSS